jgi:hypothetical protein
MPARGGGAAAFLALGVGVAPADGVGVVVVVELGDLSQCEDPSCFCNAKNEYPVAR